VILILSQIYFKKMKNRIFTLFLVTFTHFSIAQVQQEKSFAMSPAAAESAEAVTARGWRTNISISLPEVKKSMVNRLWADYARNRFGSRVKYDRKTREFVALDANVSTLSAGRVNLIGQTTQSGRDVRFNLSLEIPEMSASPAAFTSRRTPDATFILKDFAREVEREKVRLRILDEDRNLQKMENELRQLKNANLRYHREIEYAEAKILKARENITQNEKDQVLAAERIEKQKGLVAQVKRLFQQL
jgi:hypothetical protein